MVLKLMPYIGEVNFGTGFSLGPVFTKEEVLFVGMCGRFVINGEWIFVVSYFFLTPCAFKSLIFS